ncbi:hypothetical protein ACTXT7_016465 [Hymenolepis weldensis]
MRFMFHLIPKEPTCLHPFTHEDDDLPKERLKVLIWEEIQHLQENKQQSQQQQQFESMELTESDAMVNVFVCEVRDQGFDAHQCTSSERKGQLHRLSMATKGNGRIRITN